MDSCVSAFVSGGTTFASPTNGVYISDIEFHASIIHCKEQVLQAISMPMYSIPTESYNCFEIQWSRSTQIEQLLPFKYVSLKTIFMIMRPRTILHNNDYYLNSFGCEDIYQYSFRCGSKIIPPNRVKTPLTQNNIEAFEELKKAFHTGGGTLAALGIHNFTKYNVYTSRF